MINKNFATLLFAVLFLCLSFYLSQHFDIGSIRSLLKEHQLIAMPLFVLIYVAATIFLLPASALTVLAGFLFGAIWGGLLSLVSATLGAGLVLILARLMTDRWFQPKWHERINQFIAGVNREGWRFVAFVRLTPLFPFNLSNYAFALTTIKLLPYTLTNFICMSPGAFAYAYLGHLGSEMANSQQAIMTKQVLIALSLIAALLFIPTFVYSLRKKGQDKSS